MGIIANDSIKIEGISEKFELRDLYIQVKPNAHGTARISIRVKDEGSPANVIKSISDKLITITSTETENSGVLFKGYATACNTNTVKSSGVVNLELVSTSIKLDEKYEYESYQNKEITYGELIKTVAGKSAGSNSFCDSLLSSEKINKPIIQYRETNWEFVRRLASRKWLPVIIDETADKPAFTVGYKTKDTALEKDFDKSSANIFIRYTEYCERNFNEKDSKASLKEYSGMELVSIRNLEIGSRVLVSGESYILCSKTVKMQNAHLVFVYEAGSEKLYGLTPIYNEFLRGRCLEGKVVRAKDEKIKLNLILNGREEKKPEAELYEFPWMPETGNLMYSMPEENTIVSLYIGGAEEGDAIVINSLRKELGKDIDNPDNKYYTTKYEKRMYLKRDSVGFSNEAKDEGSNYLSINDTSGITFDSGKDIYIKAKKDINIVSGGEINIKGSKIVQAEKGSIALLLKKRVDVIGTKARFEFGAAIPEEVKTEDGDKLQEKSGGQEKPTETGTATEVNCDGQSTKKGSKHLPKSNGKWEGGIGNSKWIPDDDKIAGKANPNKKSWKQIKKEFNIDGIVFVDGEPDFSVVSRAKAHIDDFSESRYKNFKQADEYIAKKRNCTPQEVKQWRKNNKYTWHEREDCKTMDKVPSIVHNNIPHSGGISVKKKIEWRIRLNENN